ncbi:hypothetical protein [Vibrio jasicida]|uniref:hypothetical protein n=1 Tax=Vibrio jasicida TaxID=766224 RepID=UPI0006975387|nr:hypothetical protein [Vibrio jasicida]
MKKTVLALVAAVSMGMSVSAIATPIGDANFQWVGAVPAPSTSTDAFWIVTANGGELLQANNGFLKFDNNNGVINLVESQKFGFKVVKNAAPAASGDDTFNSTTDKESQPFNARLGALEVGKNGLPSSVDASGYFAIEAQNQATGANTVLTTSADVSFAKDQVAYIQAVKNKALTPEIAAKGLDAQPKDVWQIIATVGLTVPAAAL